MESKVLSMHSLHALSKPYVASVRSNVSAQKGGLFSMLETNLRIVRPGYSLKIAVRRASVQGPTLSPDLLERACGVLRYRHGLAAVTSDSGLLVATDRPLTPLHLESEEWELDVA